MMRVSNITLAHYCLDTENAAEQLGLVKATDFSLDMARDLIDTRAENARLQARITELEGPDTAYACGEQKIISLLGAANKRITEQKQRITELEGRSGYCAECERLSRKVEELESQLAGARDKKTEKAQK
jgi:BMFP domain-containing protein YqiC